MTNSWLLMSRIFLRSTAMVSVGAFLPATSWAAEQETAERPESASAGEIIVTARKREETLISVPVAVAALGSEQLERYATRDLQALAMQVPGLVIQPFPTGSGGSVSLRGVNSTGTNPSGDPAVSFNVDGVQVGASNIIRLGQIDLEQIEVLKGPQALFFGKNSPGGIISLRSADPGDSLEAKITADYEFNARERNLTAAIGGPLTDTLGVRVAVSHNHMRGWRENLTPNDPANFIFGPASGRYSGRTEFFARGTILFKPTAELTIRAKYNYNHAKAADPFNGADRIYCPRGAPQTQFFASATQNIPAQLDDCKINDKFYGGRIPPAILSAFPDQFPFQGQRMTQQLGSFDINYELANGINLTSVTGYYKLRDRFIGNASYQPISVLSAGTFVNRREISEELRLTTDREDWPVNFMIGGYYQDLKFYNGTPTLFLTSTAPSAIQFGGISPVPGGAPINSFSEFFMDGRTLSVFGQAIWKITDTLELSGGARYTEEKKSFTYQRTNGTPGALVTINPVLGSPDEIKFTNTSPELTLAFRPNSDLTIFGSIRNGFKSGGYNTAGTPQPGEDIVYRPEKVRGGEIGIKGQTGPLRFGATAYSYLYKNLQLNVFNPITTRQSVLNAAAARVKGIELEATWRAPIEGLELHGSVNYNKARFKEFFPSCWTGQTVAEGCNINLQANGRYVQQNLTGKPLPLAPDWVGNLGVVFDHDLGSSLRLTVTADGNYSGSYFAQLEEAAFVKQKEYVTLDASVRIGDPDKAWQVAFIGRNLTQVWRSRFVSQVSGTGSSTLTGSTTAGGRSDYSAQVGRGRELHLQLTVQFR